LSVLVLAIFALPEDVKNKFVLQENSAQPFQSCHEPTLTYEIVSLDVVSPNLRTNRGKFGAACVRHKVWK
ncbi:MAG: hypothetical protein VX228_01240, partial [Pseudomonadota bacterium]|nr:hypothetical protein [Pseudomonadota bacterium]